MMKKIKIPQYITSSWNYFAMGVQFVEEVMVTEHLALNIESPTNYAESSKSGADYKGKMLVKSTHRNHRDDREV